MITRTTQITLLPAEDSPIFDERGFIVSITDEAGGEFVEIENGDYKLRVDPSEWPELRAAIDRMIGECGTEVQP